MGMGPQLPQGPHGMQGQVQQQMGTMPGQPGMQGMQGMQGQQQGQHMMGQQDQHGQYDPNQMQQQQQGMQPGQPGQPGHQVSGWRRCDSSKDAAAARVNTVNNSSVSRFVLLFRCNWFENSSKFSSFSFLSKNLEADIHFNIEECTYKLCFV